MLAAFSSEIFALDECVCKISEIRTRINAAQNRTAMYRSSADLRFSLSGFPVSGQPAPAAGFSFRPSVLLLFADGVQRVVQLLQIVLPVVFQFDAALALAGDNAHLAAKPAVSSFSHSAR